MKKEDNLYIGEVWADGKFIQKVYLEEADYRVILLINKLKSLSDEEVEELNEIMDLKFQEGFHSADLYYS